jgi:hypothetical protein
MPGFKLVSTSFQARFRLVSGSFEAYFFVFVPSPRLAHLVPPTSQPREFPLCPGSSYGVQKPCQGYTESPNLEPELIRPAIPNQILARAPATC